MVTVKVAADAPLLGHGEIEARPTPDPSSTRTSDEAVATKAPAKMAGHETADTADSVTEPVGWLATRCWVRVSIVDSPSRPEQNERRGHRFHPRRERDLRCGGHVEPGGHQDYGDLTQVKTFHCTHCQHLVFFENIRCLNCGHALAYLPDRNLIAAVLQGEDGLWRYEGPGGQDQAYRLCANYDRENVCNWAVSQEDTQTLCRSCRLTHVITDLTVQ